MPNLITGGFGAGGSPSGIILGGFFSGSGIVVVGTPGTLQNAIAGDWEIFDGTETVTLTSHRNPANVVPGVKALAGNLTRREVMLLSATSIGVEPTDISFSIWVQTMGGLTPELHDTITREDGSKWTIISSGLLTIDTRWRAVTRKQVAA